MISNNKSTSELENPSQSSINRRAGLAEIASPMLKVVSLGKSASGHLFLAKSLCINGRYGPALDEIDAALAENPELSAAHGLKGLILFFRADYLNAERALRKAIEFGNLDEHLADYWLVLAKVKLELGNLDEALESVVRAIAIDSTKSAAHDLQADILRLTQQDDRAIDAYRLALTWNPLLTKARYKLGILLLKKGFSGEALQQTILARRLEPSDPNTRISLGNMFVGLQRFDEAIVEYRAAVQIAPLLAQALPLGLMGRAYLKLNQVTEAIAMFRAALERDPKQVNCYLDLAEIYLKDGFCDAAIALLETAEKVDTRYPLIRERLEQARAALAGVETKPHARPTTMAEGGGP